ncbi:ARM repeat superfamily protein isoform X3 [Tasmannia lanceolata]|uniref:ARM repeat superfamily protein isoform X3 n=1 Tax=Tasmannia lanceolata TaxID=3420 RepID=UPI004062FAE3
MALSGIRAWRTAFLTLRDETLTFPPRTLLPDLLRNLIFSHSEILVSAASALPPHEIASDLILLVELAGAISEGEDVEYTFINTCHLIHDVSCRIRLEMNSSSWVVMFGFFEKMVQWSLCTDTKTACSGNAARMKAIREILEILRNCSLAENSKILELLLHIISRSHAVLFCSSYSSGNQRYAIDIGTKIPKCNDLWEVQTIAFSMIGDAFSRNGSNISVNMWQSMLEVLRKVIDGLVSRSLLVEDYVMSRFYNSLLHCLHLVLSDPKGSLSEHVAGFVASLQMFFTYGITNKSLVVFKEKEFSSINLNSRLEQSRKIERGGTYRPPHLRKREEMSVQPFKARGFRCSSDCEPFGLGFMSSDSEHSDSDGPVKDTDRFRCSKARIAAIICIQDLCEADPKSLTAYWPMLLPTNDVLQLRKYQATLMTCLLFDPILKTRMASASALAAMLDGPSSVFLQVAEYKESTKCGSFTTLSSSLGQILMQLHAGLLYLIQHETHSGLLASVFKLLMLLISATPYIRMPIELLPTVISTVHKRILEDFSLKTNQTSLLATALSCLASALSTSPPSSQVAELLQEGTSTDVVGVQPNSSVLGSMFQFSQRVMHPTIAFEALQALRAVSHNYPNVMAAYWEQVSATVYGLLREGGPDCPIYEVQSRPWKVDVGNALGSTPEKCTMAAIRVRAASVTCFAGTTSSVFFLLPKEKQDFIISSVISLAISDEVPSVRAAACRAIGVISCFPQIFESTEILVEFIRAAEINTHDTLVSVRITASWALANICDSLRHRASDLHLDKCSSGPNAYSGSISLLAECALRLTKDGDKIKSNAVRALGNLSRFVRFTNQSAMCGPVDGMASYLAIDDVEFLELSNESEASGSVPNFLGDPHWLERMVQAFLSCVTTGNVKVQWNVCHALGNLFLNETLKLQDMIWAPSVYSILLLLLRDSTNFKIRIHAASALAVPTSRHEYGSSFSDVVQGLEHILENLSSDQSLTPSSFKYMGTLEKQLTSTTLHVLGLVSCNDPPPLQDFLAKKASFLEEWLKSLWSSLAEQTSDQLAPETTSIEKKAMVSKAIRSLLQIYEGSNKLQSIARRFEKLADCLS